MKKIPTIFQRTEDRRGVTSEWNPECLWVRDGEGTPTRKWDGSCCLVRGPKDMHDLWHLFKRYEAKPGSKIPDDALPSPDQWLDPVTGKTQCWVPVGEGPEDQWHREAWKDFWNESNSRISMREEGTYELIGPKVNGNKDRSETHRLVKHGSTLLAEMAFIFSHTGVTREKILSELMTRNIEGIVWHHEDGRMAKIKRRDFGLPW